MTDSSDLLEVREILEAAGLRVQRVPEADTKRCDLRARDDREHYLIEVKALHDDAAIAEELRAGRVYYRNRWADRRGKFSRRIDAAVRQLRATANDPVNELLLVALIGRARFWSNVFMSQIVGALYGARTLVDLVAPRTPPKTVGKCLYFSRSAFLEHPAHLDGALIMDDSGAGLCLNDYSDRAQRVRDSRLGQFFSSCGLLHDVVKLERAGGFLVADTDIDRGDEHAVLQYLARKYGLKRPIALRSCAFVAGCSVT
jgi:hypothetical protein